MTRIFTGFRWSSFHSIKQTSQPQNTKNLETDEKNSGDNIHNQVNTGSNKEKVFKPSYNLLKRCVEHRNKLHFHSFNTQSLSLYFQQTDG